MTAKYPMKIDEIVQTQSPDWYENRHKLECNQVFRLYDDSLVKLDSRVEGDGTQWQVADWYGDHWSHEGSIIEPGDLRGEPLPDPATGR